MRRGPFTSEREWAGRRSPLDDTARPQVQIHHFGTTIPVDSHYERQILVCGHAISDNQIFDSGNATSESDRQILI